MKPHEINKVPYDVTIFKILRFYHIFDPNSTVVFNYNVYHVTLTVFTAIIILTSICGLLGFIIETEDTIDEISLFQIICAHLQSFLAVLKIIMLVNNAEKIWNLLDITRTNFMTSKQCSKDIDIQRNFYNTTIKLSNVLCIFVISIIAVWSTFPLILNSFMVKSNERIKRYENILNLRFPVTTDVYNEYYFIFYVIEVTILAYIGYAVLIFDTFLIIYICYVLIELYRINKQAFKIIGHEQQLQNGCEERYNNNDVNYENFKAIMFDQQNLHIKLKSYYSIVWPIILCNVAVTSTTIIMFSYSLITICIATETSLPVLSIIKIFVPFVYLAIQLYIYCYLLENINNIKESVTYGMYCCNWTMEDLKFKKLLLLAMRMNDTNKLKIKTTPIKIINLNFFANVMMTCYNIVSVMLKTRRK